MALNIPTVDLLRDFELTSTPPGLTVTRHSLVGRTIKERSQAMEVLRTEVDRDLW